MISKFKDMLMCTTLVGLLIFVQFCDGSYLQMSVTEKRLCGRELSDILEVLCNGKLNPMLQKKSGRCWFFEILPVNPN